MRPDFSITPIGSVSVPPRLTALRVLRPLCLKPLHGSAVCPMGTPCVVDSNSDAMVADDDGLLPSFSPTPSTCFFSLVLADFSAGAASFTRFTALLLVRVYGCVSAPGFVGSRTAPLQVFNLSTRLPSIFHRSPCGFLPAYGLQVIRVFRLSNQWPPNWHVLVPPTMLVAWVSCK